MWPVTKRLGCVGFILVAWLPPAGERTDKQSRPPRSSRQPTIWFHCAEGTETLTVQSEPHRTSEQATYFSCMTFSLMAPREEWLPCWSLQVARCRWCWSFRLAFSLQRSVTWCSSSSIRTLCFSRSPCWVSMILFSSFRYSAALLGFSVGFSIS